LGDGVIATDCDGNIRFLNPVAEDLVGWTNKEAAGLTFNKVFQILDEHGVNSSDQFLAEICEADGEQVRTGTLVSRGGSEHLVATSISVLHEGKSEVCHGAVIVIRDVSDLNKTAKALQDTNGFLIRSNEHLTELSYSLSHDLQEPLRTITCYTQLLSRRYKDRFNESEQEFLGYIVEGCGRMEGLLTALLDYYRAGTFDTTSTSLVDASACLEQALGALQGAIATSGAVIEAGKLPQVYCHDVALQQVFQNLIGNAIKYQSEEAPKIKVSARICGSVWKLTIADNGIGFNPEDADQIFGLFKRAHDRQRSGSGIGLATCRRLIERYGGRIWAESIPENGAQFHFTLPGKLA
jgi:PAS domain S-box-containing protein